MKSYQTTVVGVIGVLAGIVVGASSVQHAQMVSFSGANPNTSATDEGVARVGNTDHRLDLESDLERAVRARGAMRLHGAANDVSIGLAEFSDVWEKCVDLFPVIDGNKISKRLALCIGQQNEEKYQTPTTRQ